MTEASTNEETTNVAAINLEGVVNIAKAETLHHQMEDILKEAVPITLQASEVQRVDTAILQLLLAFFKSMASAQVSITWDGVSDELLAAVKLLGIEQELDLASQN